MLFSRSKRSIWLIVPLLVCWGVLQTASAWDMKPPAEPVRDASEAFDQAWRLEAGRQFGEPGRVAANHVASAIMMGFLFALLGALFYRMVKLNHMEQTAKRVRAGMLSFYTRMWLVSRWGFRY